MPRQTAKKHVGFKDGAILLLLTKAELLPLWFRLGMPTFTTDLVTYEIEDSDYWPAVQDFVDDGSLKVETLSGEQMEVVEEKFAGVGSVGERSVLYLAELRSAQIVGGMPIPTSFPDGLKGRIENGVWVVDRLVEGGLLGPTEGIVKIENLVLLGCPIPPGEIERRRTEWAA